ncbi:MAG: hypothetical protein RRZ24_10270 [Clostridia bacterium]
MATQQGARRPYPSNNRRRKKKKKSRTLLFSMGILAVLGAAVLIYQLIFSKQESTVSMNPTPISTSSTYLNTGDGILYQTDGQIHFYHLTDSKQNYTYGMGASDIRMSGSKSLTVVFNAASLQVVGQKAPLAFTGEVKEVECGTNHLAVLRTGEDGIDSVLILSPDGQQIGEPLIFLDQYIVDFGFYKISSEMLWVETLNVNANTPTTTISTYDLAKQSVTGVMHIQNQLVDELFITPNSVFVAATNQIIRYTHDGNKEVYRNTIYGYHPVDFSAASGSPTFLLTPRGGDFHTVKILTLAEDSAANPVETYLQLPTEGVDAFIMGSRLVVVSREKVFTYSLKGKLQSTAAFEQAIDAAVKLTDSTLMLSSNGTYYLANVK